MSKRSILPFTRIEKVIISIILINVLLYILLGTINTNSVYATQTKENYESSSKISNYDTYDDLIANLQAKYPNWNFTLLYTGLDWNTVVQNETTAVHGRNLVYYTRGSYWICSTCGDTAYDTGNWRCASTAAVQYYMDPRNWMDENFIFQFEDLSYNESVQTIDGVNQILSGTFMEGSSITYTTTSYGTATISKSYAQVIMDAAKSAGISPYHLAARIRQEVGTSGSSTSNGQYTGFVGYYNLLNINATGNSTSIISNALTYAKNQGWDTPEKAIIGGASFLSKNYISVGQSTLYLQKFDVDSSDNKLYYHQYMQNVSAAASEGYTVKESYEDMGLLNQSMNFVIPVYENMPGANEICSVTGSNIRVRSGPGTGYSALTSISNTTVVVIEDNAGTANGYTWDRIITKTGYVGYIADTYLTSYITTTASSTKNIDTSTNNNFKIDGANVICEPNTTAGKVKETYSAATITNSSGTAISDTDLIGTGYNIAISGTNYTAIKLGDVSGDGSVDARDSLRILKYSVGTYSINDGFAKAADISGDGTIDSRDSLRILKYSVGTFSITL